MPGSLPPCIAARRERVASRGKATLLCRMGTFRPCCSLMSRPMTGHTLRKFPAAGVPTCGNLPLHRTCVRVVPGRQRAERPYSPKLNQYTTGRRGCQGGGANLWGIFLGRGWGVDARQDGAPPGWCGFWRFFRRTLAHPVEIWYDRLEGITGTDFPKAVFAVGHPLRREVRLMKKITIVIELLKLELKFTVKSTGKAKTATGQK